VLLENMGKVSKKRKESTDVSKIKCTPDTKKQKLPDFTEIEFKVLLKDETSAFEGEHLSDNGLILDAAVVCNAEISNRCLHRTQKWFIVCVSFSYIT